MSTTFVRYRRTPTQIPQTHPKANAPAACGLHSDMASSSAEPPLSLLHQTPLLSAPKSHCGDVSRWCLSRALGCEHSPAKHPQTSWGLNKQQGKAPHGPKYLPKCLFSFSFKQETFSVCYLKPSKPQTSSTEALLRLSMRKMTNINKYQQRYQKISSNPSSGFKNTCNNILKLTEMGVFAVSMADTFFGGI